MSRRIYCPVRPPARGWVYVSFCKKCKRKADCFPYQQAKGGVSLWQAISFLLIALLILGIAVFTAHAAEPIMFGCHTYPPGETQPTHFNVKINNGIEFRSEAASVPGGVSYRLDLADMPLGPHEISLQAVIRKEDTWGKSEWVSKTVVNVDPDNPVTFIFTGGGQ